jgi:hypothetical protein
VQYLLLLVLGGRFDAEGERPRGSFFTMRGGPDTARTDAWRRVAGVRRTIDVS